MPSLAFLVALAASDGADAAGTLATSAAPAGNEDHGSTYRLTELAVRWLTIRRGSLLEVSVCSQPRSGTFSTYGCFAVNAGRQGDERIGGDLLEWGVRLRPGAPQFAIVAGGGMSALVSMADVVICATRQARRGRLAGDGSGGQADDGKDPTRCPGEYRPLELMGQVGLSGVVSTGRVEVGLELLVRYHVAVDLGELIDPEVPSGPSLSVGAHVAW